MHPGSEATTSNTFALSCRTTRVQRRLGRQRATGLLALESTQPLRLRWRGLDSRRSDAFVPDLWPTQAHSWSLQRTPAHDAVGHFSFDRKPLRILTGTQA